MTSITAGKKQVKVWAVLLWLLLWEIVARFIGQEILLVSPVIVLLKFFELIITAQFWQSIAFSFVRIIGGFFLALLVGILLAGLSSVSTIVRELTAPLISVIKAMPVASFIILLLIWVSSRNLSFIISFLMVLPVVYTNMLEGIRRVDGQLLEMAEVFQVSVFKKFRYIYLSQLMPYFKSACSLSLGLCWKAGVAAEVIGIPNGSIGEKLYEAKVYLETPDLFAWTLTIVLLSVCFERLFLFIVKMLARKIERS